MKIGRFLYKEKEFFGIVKENEVFDVAALDSYDLKDLKILTPTTPTKIVAVGLNYKDHAKELNMPIPDEPLIFLKPPSSALAHKEYIVYPPSSKRVDYEGELAIVIKKTAKNVSYKEAKNYILGYTIANDVTARDLQKKDVQFTRSKSFDTFTPFGPFIETDIDPSNITIKTYLNNELKQEGNTKEFIFDSFYLVSFISNIMTLHRGDIILTGTPKGVGPMQKGDEVKIEIENIGELINYVR